MFRPPARGRRAPAAALGLWAAFRLLCPAPALSASYPPQYRFHTVSTDKVSVHFHQGFEAMARQAASMATEVLSRHESRYGQRVRHVHVVIVDADDQPNGFASPLPFPLVTIRAVAPDGTDDFGNQEGWLRLVLTHELAHTVHLEESRGLWGLKKVLAVNFSESGWQKAPEPIQQPKGRFIWPVEGKIVGHYGVKAGMKYDGIDIQAPLGTAVRVADAGKVAFVSTISGYGNIIIIKHGDTYSTVYAHNQLNLAKEGSWVSQGAIIARVGNSHNFASSPTLHFQITRYNKARNPLFYLH